jgi:hypothetical protein
VILPGKKKWPAGTRKWPEIYRIGSSLLVLWYALFAALAMTTWFSGIGLGSTATSVLFGPLAGTYATGLSAGAVFLKGGCTILQIFGAISLRMGIDRHGRKPNYGYRWRPRWIIAGAILVALSIMIF